MSSMVDSPEMIALAASKKALRKAIQKKISRVPPESIAQQCRWHNPWHVILDGASLAESYKAKSASELLFASTHYRNAQKIGVYLSMKGKELQTDVIVEDALSRGKEVYIPYIHRKQGTKDSDMHMFALHSRDDYRSLQLDKWGIPSLDASSISDRFNSYGELGLNTGDGKASSRGLLDLIVMPGVAFDSDLRRLGHGKGYYDRFLRQYEHIARLSQRPMPQLVALALAEQKCEHVPTGANDWPIDALITGVPELVVKPGYEKDGSEGQ